MGLTNLSLFVSLTVNLQGRLQEMLMSISVQGQQQTYLSPFIRLANVVNIAPATIMLLTRDYSIHAT